MSSDILHQLIKGRFKDHFIKWLTQYLHKTFGKSGAHEILKDIDRWLAAIPSFPGLQSFPDGRDFSQWMGDDFKALMKIIICAVNGHVPLKIVSCLSAFIELCYIARKNMITSVDLQQYDSLLIEYHEKRLVFLKKEVQIVVKKLSPSCQHALGHFVESIHNFGAPNSTCSSITENKHIESVKEL
ncbi:hypothetical protein Moror_10072 [Moniliophthora roreri MCA 2997]|uniref:Uncharacterized protein n=1 Tax=Moniliophthora roreri (strain MCA 2997) TaxID=1381753 RepID=V2Y1L7_MONRO|nr:hypothetical protein Moror_10072 [Moniliophthora roreri MCA 2997]